jgi:hypothetical protein
MLVEKIISNKNKHSFFIEFTFVMFQSYLIVNKFQLNNPDFPVEIYYKKKMLQIQALA